MTRIRVQKYGGTSVASVEKLKSIAKRSVALQERGESLVLVVSASVL